MKLKELYYHVKAFTHWTLILSLIPLSMYVHKGFWYIFLFLSALTVISSILISLSGAAIYCMVSDKSRKEGKKEDAINRDVRLQLARVFALPTAKKCGVDTVHYEVKHKYLDMIFVGLIILTVVFLGHVALGLLWALSFVSFSVKQKAFDNFDDVMLEEI